MCFDCGLDFRCLYSQPGLCGFHRGDSPADVASSHAITLASRTDRQRTVTVRAYAGRMSIDLVGMIVILGAAARLWHLAATDTLTDPIRQRLPASLQRWVSCPRCSGFWIAAAAAAAWIISRDTAADTATTLVMSALAANWLFFAGREAIGDAITLTETAIDQARQDHQRAIDTPRERL